MNNIRNFCIIAHIDHGKSTLADRLLEMTGTIEKRKMKEQILDTMDLERERGITIKLQPATMKYDYEKTKTGIENNPPQSPLKLKGEDAEVIKLKGKDSGVFKLKEKEQGETYTLNLIDTPGHVDFAYEVSRSLAAVEGAVLLVDATKGVQAQTLANLYQAIEQDLEIIPVVNKIDLPNADVEKTKREIIHILGCKEDEIIEASGKTGKGVEKILQALVEKVPSPEGKSEKPLRALIFDSKYDTYKGVLAYVRIVDGEVRAGGETRLMASGADAEVIEVGKFSPVLVKYEKLSAGDIGYIATGLKSVDQCRVGDTITLAVNSKLQTGDIEPLPGYKEIKPMVYASFYPTEGEDYNQMRMALDKLKLNDAALTFEGESSPALGKGFRLGFLGLLHLEIVQERLKREFGFEPIITTPSVVYEVVKTSGSVEKIYAAAELPDQSQIKEIREPRVKLTIISPSEYLGEVMSLVSETTRSRYVATEYIDEERVSLEYDAPLSEIIVNFHDALKSASSGYASMNYEFAGYEAYDLVRLDIYVADEKIDAFSQIIPKEKVHTEGNRVVKKLKNVIPRHNFLIKLQAAVGGSFVARENIRPFRKDVTGYLYGGDVTRKRKLLEKQKKGKKRMRNTGKANIPQKAFLEVLKR